MGAGIVCPEEMVAEEVEREKCILIVSLQAGNTIQNTNLTAPASSSTLVLRVR